MMLSILFIIFAIIVAIAGLLYASFVYYTLNKEFEKKEWMYNSEYDYGHDVRYNEDND